MIFQGFPGVLSVFKRYFQVEWEPWTCSWVVNDFPLITPWNTFHYKFLVDTNRLLGDNSYANPETAFNIYGVDGWRVEIAPKKYLRFTEATKSNIPILVARNLVHQNFLFTDTR